MPKCIFISHTVLEKTSFGQIEQNWNFVAASPIGSTLTASDTESLCHARYKTVNVFWSKMYCPVSESLVQFMAPLIG